jgi:type IV pilus assembly protein PilY1
MIANLISRPRIRGPSRAVLLAVWVAAIVAVIGWPATGFATNLAELPLKASVLAKPNVIFGLDDSGSMDWEVLVSTDGGEFWWNTSSKTGWDANGKFGSSGTSMDYLFPTSTGSGAADTLPSDSVPPTPQFAALRSSDYHKLYFNPAQTYKPWAPGYVASAKKIYPDISLANALAATPSVPAPTEPLGSTTVDLMATRWWQMKAFTGMVMPAGSQKQSGSTWTTLAADTAATSTTTIRVPVYPATYWASEVCTVDAVNCVAVPGGGATLKRHEIKRANYASDAAFTTAMQNFANWFTYYRKRHLMLSAAMGQVLDGLSGMRAGVVQFNNRSNVTMYDLDSTDPAKNGLRIAGVFYANPANGSTPTRETLKYIGQQFARTTVDGLGNKIVQYACQRNNAFIMTDGFYNGNNTAAPSYDRAKWGGSAPYAVTAGNTLADLGLAFYTLNPRADLATGRVPPGDPARSNADLNTDLHVNTYGMTLNVSGDLWPAVGDPFATAITWPTPQTDMPSAIDDLWHATINGRGRMYLATSPQETAVAIEAGLTDIRSQVGAQSGVAVSSINLGRGDSQAYLATYNPAGWSGDLTASPIDKATGAVSSSVTWSAQALLSSRDWTTRVIATAVGGAGVGFTAAAVGSLVNPDPASYTSDAVVAYLRGSRAGEGATFRLRTGLIGAVINAEPTLAPDQHMVYLASGEGMLHAFDTVSGVEQWAFVPPQALATIGGSVERGWTFKTQLDATPVVAALGSSGSQRLLVGGMGAAGRGYYALDVSQPVGLTEAAVAAQFKWAFPSAAQVGVAANIGYTVGRPSVVRLADGSSVALLTSGYDNGTNIGDGRGRLWMVDAATGAVRFEFVTGYGSNAAEAGLAQVAGFLEPDGSVQYVYGGDLLGNLWRFDLVAQTTTRIAQLQDSAGNAQPVTTAPELVGLAGQRVVLVGTGRLLDITDFGSARVQSFYAIADGTPLVGNARSSLVAQVYTRNAASPTGDGTMTANPVDWKTRRGWYFDLPAGEQDNTDPILIYGAVSFVTNLIGGNDCSQSSMLYSIDLTTGGRVGGAANTAGFLSQIVGTNTTASRVVVLRTSDGHVIGTTHRSDNSVFERNMPQAQNLSAGKAGWREIQR